VIPAVLPTYARYDLAFDRGEGPYLFATNGRKYLDFASGIAVTVLGHSHPHLVAALTEQLKKVWHTSNLSSPTPSPTPYSSEILGLRRSNARSRWCASTMTRTARPRNTA